MRYYTIRPSSKPSHFNLNYFKSKSGLSSKNTSI